MSQLDMWDNSFVRHAVIIQDLMAESFPLCTGPRSKRANSGWMVSPSKPLPVSCTLVTPQLSCLKRKRTQASMPGLVQTQQTDTVLAQERQVAPLRACQVAAAQISHPFRVRLDTQWDCVMLLVVGHMFDSACQFVRLNGMMTPNLGVSRSKECQEEGK